MSDAPPLIRLLVIDRMSDRFADAAAFVADMVEHVNQEWRRARVSGSEIVDATWIGGVLWLDTVPSAAPLTVEAVGEFLRQKKGKAA